MGDSLDRILEAVRIVVERIDAPGIPGPIVLGLADPVEDRVAHEHVRGAHVDPGPEHVFPVTELPGTHPAKELEVLGDRPIPEGAFGPCDRDGPPSRTDRFLRLGVHVRPSLVDQEFGVLVHPVEVVRSVVEVLTPVEAQPLHIGTNGLHVLVLLGGRVRIVEAEVAASAKLVGDPEVEEDGLGVANVQEAVGFRGETGDYPAAMPPGRDVCVDNLAYEVAPLRGDDA